MQGRILQPGNKIIHVLFVFNNISHRWVRLRMRTDICANTRLNIIECINGLKIKNTEGYDRIPQRILIDGRDALIEPLVSLFNLIYRDTKVPEQWLISKIIPVHKKGDKSINGLIPLTWLHLSYTTYKVKCKDIFLK